MSFGDSPTDATSSGTWAAPLPRQERPSQPLTQAYRLVAEGRTDDALDLIFDLVDELLCAGQFDACDRVLTRIDLDRMDTDTLVGVLSVTMPAKARLASRPALLGRVEACLVQRHGVAATIELLSGLR